MPCPGLPTHVSTRIALGRPDGCWLWQGHVNAGGYGQVSVRHAMKYAHRAVWEIVVGPIPPKMTLDHLCGNKTCVNPMHLELVTRAENARRAHIGQGHHTDPRIRQAAYRERQRQRRETERVESGWWVSI